MAALLLEENFHLIATQGQAYDFTITISTGEIKFEQITEWLRLNTKPIETI
jgi:prophage maintenance system killer protein